MAESWGIFSCPSGMCPSSAGPAMRWRSLFIRTGKIICGPLPANPWQRWDSLPNCGWRQTHRRAPSCTGGWKKICLCPGVNSREKWRKGNHILSLSSLMKKPTASPPRQSWINFSARSPRTMRKAQRWIFLSTRKQLGDIRRLSTIPMGAWFIKARCFRNCSSAGS